MGTDDDARRRLRIYLNDHLMGSTGGVALAKRLVRSNAGTAFEAPLRQLSAELVEHRDALLDLMRALDLPRNRLKVAAAAVGERAGRLKVNGQLVGYSPLSRLVELEGLHAGANAQLRMWLLMEDLGVGAAVGVDLDRLIARTRSQLERLEELRREAGEQAIGEALRHTREEEPTAV